MGGRQSWRILSPAEQRDRSEAKALATLNKLFRGGDVLNKAGIEIYKKGEVPSLESIQGEMGELADIHGEFLASEGLIDNKDDAKAWGEKIDAATDWKIATPSQREMLDLDKEKGMIDLWHGKEPDKLTKETVQEVLDKWYGSKPTAENIERQGYKGTEAKEALQKELKNYNEFKNDVESGKYHLTYDKDGSVKDITEYNNSTGFTNNFYGTIEDTRTGQTKQAYADTWAKNQGQKVAERYRQLEKWSKPAHQKNREKLIKMVSKGHRQHTIGKGGKHKGSIYSSIHQRLGGVSKEKLHSKVRELYQRYKDRVGYNPKKGNPSFYKGMTKVAGSGRKKNK